MTRDDNNSSSNNKTTITTATLELWTYKITSILLRTTNYEPVGSKHRNAADRAMWGQRSLWSWRFSDVKVLGGITMSLLKGNYPHQFGVVWGLVADGKWTKSQLLIGVCFQEIWWPGLFQFQSHALRFRFVYRFLCLFDLIKFNLFDFPSSKFKV